MSRCQTIHPLLKNVLDLSTLTEIASVNCERDNESCTDEGLLVVSCSDAMEHQYSFTLWNTTQVGPICLKSASHPDRRTERTSGADLEHADTGNCIVIYIVGTVLTAFYFAAATKTRSVRRSYRDNPRGGVGQNLSPQRSAC